MRMLVRQDEAVDRERLLPFQGRGRVLWLTPEQAKVWSFRHPGPGMVTRQQRSFRRRRSPRVVRRMVLLSPLQAVGEGTLR
jgi:hypothetical protein